MPMYRFLLSSDTGRKAARYLDQLRAGQPVGARLAARLGGHDLQQLAPESFIGLLLQTKIPQIFAESAVAGDGSDWTLTELSILGDISVAVPVTVFDDGRHQHPAVHDPALAGELLFTPGALLRNGLDRTPADWPEVVTPAGEIDPEGYFRLYERRLMPVLRHVQQTAQQQGRPAIVTVPGLGCGQFAGRFQGRLGRLLQTALERLLDHHAGTLPAIRLVRYDPYSECQDHESRHAGTILRVRPLLSSHHGLPQLCRPADYAEPGDDFGDALLFSVVAWDHVSWPGNDFYAGARATDDGVKAAATDVMRAMTGMVGRYDRLRRMYLPPAPHRTWRDVIDSTGVDLDVSGHLHGV